MKKTELLTKVKVFSDNQQKIKEALLDNKSFIEQMKDYCKREILSKITIMAYSIKEGKLQNNFLCHCGHIWSTPLTARSVYSGACCPKCSTSSSFGNKKIVIEKTTKTLNLFSNPQVFQLLPVPFSKILEIEEGIAIIVSGYLYFDVVSSGGDTAKELLENCQLEISDKDSTRIIFSSIYPENSVIKNFCPGFFVFSVKEGFMRLSYTQKSLQNISSLFSLGEFYKDSSYQKLEKLLMAELPLGYTTCEEAIHIINEKVAKEMLSKKSIKKSSSAKEKREKLKTCFKNWVSPNVDDKILKDFVDCPDVPIKIINVIGSSVKIEWLCKNPECNKLNICLVDNKEDDIVLICPHCGKKVTFSENPLFHFLARENFSVLRKNYSYWSNVDSETVLFETFNLTYCVQRNELTKMPEEKAKITITSNMRLFFHKNDLFLYGKYLFPSGASFCEEPLSHIMNKSFSSSNKVLNTPEELIEIINNSPLKYSGVLEAWGLSSNKDLKIEPAGTFNDCSYLRIWANKGFIELLLKAGLVGLVKAFQNSPSDYNKYVTKTKKTVCELLDITKPVLKILQEQDKDTEGRHGFCSFSILSTAKKLWETDNTLNTVLYNRILSVCKEIPNPDIFAELKTFNLSISKVLDYIQECYQFQCIEPIDALVLWKDYLLMAKKIGYNLKNTRIKYPTSLKREHDIASFALNAMESSCDESAFKNKAKENCYYEYSLKSRNLVVKIPKSPQEVINEGMELHHCVSHYVNAIIEGKSIVAFIRKINVIW